MRFPSAYHISRHTPYKRTCARTKLANPCTNMYVELRSQISSRFQCINIQQAPACEFHRLNSVTSWLCLFLNVCRFARNERPFQFSFPPTLEGSANNVSGQAKPFFPRPPCTHIISIFAVTREASDYEAACIKLNVQRETGNWPTAMPRHESCAPARSTYSEFLDVDLGFVLRFAVLHPSFSPNARYLANTWRIPGSLPPSNDLERVIT